jgi:hypothetical protein
MAFEIAIIYNGRGGRPLRLARVRDHHLLTAVASAAVLEAEREAAEIGRRDATLGQIQLQEARKLRHVLEPLMGFASKVM